MIIATGNLANQFLQTQFLPVKSIAGEITFFPETKQTKTLHYPLCADGYLTTSLEGVHCLGATYEVGARSKKQSNVENLERLRQFINNPEECNPKALNSRVSVRATTPDYMPIIGAVPKADWFIDHYQELKKDANVFLPKAGAYYENLYVLTGFGSNGLTYGPLSASLLVNKMLNKPQAISTELLKALSPARFLIRDLCRGKI